MSCIDDVLKAVTESEVLTKSEAKQLLKHLRNIERNHKGTESLESRIFREIGEIISDIKEAALIEKRNNFINVRIRKRFDDFVETFDGDSDQALEAYMVGNAIGTDNARRSIGTRQAAYETQFQAMVVHELRQKDLIPLLNSRELDSKIADEMWELGKPEGRPGISGSADAQAIAEVFHKAQRFAVQVQNDLGANIKPLPGYIIKQAHDAVRIRKAKGKWTTDMLELLDHDLTFKGADPAEFLAAANKELALGEHYKTKGGDASDTFLAFKGPGNLARKASAERVFHFKDAAAFHKYNELYGSGNLTESLFHGLRRAAKNAGVMEGFGTNPRAMFDDLLTKLKEDAPTDTAKQLQKQKFEWFMSDLDGTTNIPGNITGSRWGAGLRAIQVMSKLGMATLSSFNDVVTQASALKIQGIGYFSGYSQALGNVLQGRGADGSVRREIADLIGEGADGMLGQILSRFNPGDNTAGMLSKGAQISLKLFGLNWWTDAHKTGVANILSRDLANNAGKSFSEMAPELQGLLKRYFNSREWDMMRRSALRDEGDGRVFMTPDRIAALPDSVFTDEFGDMTAKQIRIARQDLEISLRSYFTDRIDAAVLTPGAKERAFMRAGTNPGTATGESVRFMMQFKGFPMTFITKQLSQFFPGGDRWYKQLLNGQADVAGLTHLIMASTALGYLSMTAKDAFKNKTPRDPTSVKTWSAAFVQGGGLGLYGDFLFSEFNRFNQGALETLAGPTVGTASDIAKLLSMLATSDVNNRGDKAANKAFNIVRSNLPFQNLFYTKAAVDYMIFNNIQEALNPGYMRRMEKRIKKDNDQEFIFQ